MVPAAQSRQAGPPISKTLQRTKHMPTHTCSTSRGGPEPARCHHSSAEMQLLHMLHMMRYFCHKMQGRLEQAHVLNSTVLLCCIVHNHFSVGAPPSRDIQPLSTGGLLAGLPASTPTDTQTTTKVMRSSSGQHLAISGHQNTWRVKS